MTSGRNQKVLTPEALAEQTYTRKAFGAGLAAIAIYGGTAIGGLALKNHFSKTHSESNLQTFYKAKEMGAAIYHFREAKRSLEHSHVALDPQFLSSLDQTITRVNNDLTNLTESDSYKSYVSDLTFNQSLGKKSVAGMGTAWILASAGWIAYGLRARRKRNEELIQLGINSDSKREDDRDN